MTDEPPSCDVTVDPIWAAAGSPLERLCAESAAAVLARLNVPPAGIEIGFRFTDDAGIEALNAAWRGKPRPIDVLSFPVHDGETAALPGCPRLLGDVVLAFETCRRDAAEAGNPLADHVRHLLVHGLLHLFHYDHQTPTEADTMESLEVEILATLGVPDPYAGPPDSKESAR
mgnify:CR=1 FL=1